MNTEKLQAGVALLRAGRFHSAEQFFRACLAAQGDNAAAWFYLGAAQHGGGRLQPAADSFARAIGLAPGLTQAREARAAVLVSLGHLAEAESELRAAVAAAPSDQASVSLAIVLQQRGKLQEARELYDGVLALHPDHFAARLNRGALLLAQGGAEEALADFLRLPGERVETHLNRARALFELHRDEEALLAAERALSLDPMAPRAWLDRIIALASLGRAAESSAALAEAVEKRIALTSLPGGPRDLRELHPAALYTGRALARQWVCDWRDRDRLVQALRHDLRGAAEAAEPGLLFHALSLPLHRAELGRLAEIVAAGARQEAARMQVSTPVASGSGATRIRVGFLCATLRDHPGARLLRQIFLRRDRAALEYIVFAQAPDLGATVARDIQTAADRLYDVSGLSSTDIAQRLRDEHLDVLVDDGAYLDGSRPELLALRVAPLQVAYLGTPCTLGPGMADYRLNDAFSTPPEWQPGWPERLALMNHPTYIFDTDAQPGLPGEREAHGLPRHGFVWCCFNQARKIEPQVFGIWMRLLEATDGSVLWLLDPGPVARTNLRREAGAAGISPERLVFAPRIPFEAHLGRQAHADLFLDTIFYSAHTTAVDALWGGLPLLTCAGDTMASRVAGSFLKAAGLDELLVETLEQYEAKALEIARSAPLLKRLKQRVSHARQHSPLFDSSAGVQAFERALKAMVERHRAGLPPDTLIID